MKKYFSLTITFILTLTYVVGQTSRTSIESLSPKTFNPTPSVVYHDNNSKFPKTINVEGTIIDISFGYCGVFCAGGVIKVKLEKKIEGYTDTLVYLVTACLSTNVKKNTYINVGATTLTREDKECYYKSIENIFDSRGTPFYKLSEEEARKIK